MTIPPLPSFIWIAVALAILLLGNGLGDKIGSTDYHPPAPLFSQGTEQMIFTSVLFGILLYVIKSKK